MFSSGYYLPVRISGKAGLNGSVLKWAICLFLFLTLQAGAFAAERIHIVRNGESLFEISRKYNVSVADISERNSLGRSSHIVSGQRLYIPAKRQGAAPSRGAAFKPEAKVVLPESIQKAINKAPVRKGRWRYIVVHHSGVDTGTVAGMDRYHRDVRHMENGLAYHFVIGNGSGMGDGEITAGHRWIAQLDGGHLASEVQNQYSLGICLVGNFDKHGPSQSQLRSLKLLVEALLERCDLTPSAVKAHKEINVIGTRCPGSRFSISDFRKSLQR